jgi:hypothetical protein
VVPVELVRGGQAMSVEVTLGEWRPLVPRTRYDQAPRYLVFGGLVFQALTRDVLATWGQVVEQGPQGSSSTTTTWARARPSAARW